LEPSTSSKKKQVRQANTKHKPRPTTENKAKAMTKSKPPVEAEGVRVFTAYHPAQ
jgi:hypothetical protein